MADTCFKQIRKGPDIGQEQEVGYVTRYKCKKSFLNIVSIKDLQAWGKNPFKARSTLKYPVKISYNDPSAIQNGK